MGIGTSLSKSLHRFFFLLKKLTLLVKTSKSLQESYLSRSKSCQSVHSDNDTSHVTLFFWFPLSHLYTFSCFTNYMCTTFPSTPDECPLIEMPLEGPLTPQTLCETWKNKTKNNLLNSWNKTKKHLLNQSMGHTPMQESAINLTMMVVLYRFLFFLFLLLIYRFISYNKHLWAGTHFTNWNKFKYREQFQSKFRNNATNSFLGCLLRQLVLVL